MWSTAIANRSTKHTAAVVLEFALQQDKEMTNETMEVQP
jgi:hypothetical protein